MKRDVVTVAMVLLILLQVGNNVEIYSLEDEMDTPSKQLNQGDETTISLDILLVGNSYTSSNTLNLKLEQILDDSGENSDVQSVTAVSYTHLTLPTKA